MLIAVLVACVALNSYQLLSTRKELRNVTSDNRIEELESGEEDLIPFGSDEVKEVNRSFDERILEMKRDLDAQRPTNEGSGNVAPQYHPQVHNLPHDSVTIPSKVTHEYAE